MTQSTAATKRVAEDRRRDAGREAWKAKWRAAAEVRAGWTSDQLEAEEAGLAAEIARRVERGEVQKLAGSALLNNDSDLSSLLTTWTVDDRV